jgi:uncharacterized 2Fe-2S/4Fe-4S cluster protein (DUF4445 family)
MKNVTVQFTPLDVRVSVAPGTTVLDAAMEAGVHINAACGGQGTCGRCRVRLVSGTVDCAPGGLLSAQDIEEGFRLACGTRVLGDATIGLIHISKLEAPPQELHTGRAAAPDLASACEGPPAVRKVCVTIDAPSLTDTASDAARLMRALKQQHGFETLALDPAVLQELPRAARSGNRLVTVTLEPHTCQSPPGNGAGPAPLLSIIRVEAGDTTAQSAAIAFDIGTTSLWGRLLDLRTGEAIALASHYNPQIKYGDDVITRMVQAQKPGGRELLQQAVLEGLNSIIDRLINDSGIEPGCISHVVAAGNTVMSHLLLGLETRHIRQAPYTPVVNVFPPLRAQQAGLHVPTGVPLQIFPAVAAYVGGDIVAGVLASGLYTRPELCLFIDIGTNGEIVLGNRDWLMTASCSAGPAFEGGGLRCGMRAAPGAIERLHIDPETLEPMIITVGHAAARGICGSGAISILACFLSTGIIGQNGRFNTQCSSQRIRKGPDGVEFVLSSREENGNEDVVITEPDINNLLRAKAAMFAGYQCLLEKTSLRFEDLQQVIIAGAFGDFLDVREAVTIGLLPDIAPERFVFIGNASLLGAQLSCLSGAMLADAERISRNMTNIELSDDSSFMDRYMAAMFLPHTDTRLFSNAALPTARAGVAP